jgi:5-methylcytosine-specific restriction protein A
MPTAPILAGVTLTREKVLAAIAKCDALGVDAFLKEHGYRPSTKFVLRYNGKSYPSKAILGVAAGLKAREFSGGTEHTVRLLDRLGFNTKETK